MEYWGWAWADYIVTIAQYIALHMRWVSSARMFALNGLTPKKLTCRHCSKFSVIPTSIRTLQNQPQNNNPVPLINSIDTLPSIYSVSYRHSGKFQGHYSSCAQSIYIMRQRIDAYLPIFIKSLHGRQWIAHIQCTYPQLFSTRECGAHSGSPQLVPVS